MSNDPPTPSEKVLAASILQIWKWPGAGGDEGQTEEASALRAFVKTLQEGGYIEHEPGPSGARLRFTLTDKTRALLRKVRG